MLRHAGYPTPGSMIDVCGCFKDVDGQGTANDALTKGTRRRVSLAKPASTAESDSTESSAAV